MYSNFQRFMQEYEALEGNERTGEESCSCDLNSIDNTESEDSPAIAQKMHTERCSEPASPNSTLSKPETPVAACETLEEKASTHEEAVPETSSPEASERERQEPSPVASSTDSPKVENEAVEAPTEEKQEEVEEDKEKAEEMEGNQEESKTTIPEDEQVPEPVEKPEDPETAEEVKDEACAEQVPEDAVEAEKELETTKEEEEEKPEANAEECAEASPNCSTSVVEVKLEESCSEVAESSKDEGPPLGEESGVDKGEGEAASEERLREPSNNSPSISENPEDVPAKAEPVEVNDSLCNDSDVPSPVDNATQVPNIKQQIPTISTVCDATTTSLPDGVPEIVSSNADIVKDESLVKDRSPTSARPRRSSLPATSSEPAAEDDDDDERQSQSRAHMSPQKRPRSASTSTQVDPNHFGNFAFGLCRHFTRVKVKRSSFFSI